MGLLQVVIALCAVCVTSTTAMIECQNLFNFDIYLEKLMGEPSLVPCMTASGMAESVASGASPNRQQLTKFFDSVECRAFFNAVRSNFQNNMPDCAADSFGTPLKQFATLDFDQMKAVYEQAMYGAEKRG